MRSLTEARCCIAEARWLQAGARLRLVWSCGSFVPELAKQPPVLLR